ncbi:MAG TPA: ABC transporter ATP-binding protein [Candidatus Eisenbacteria bacterium]|nr:ABC transporter ATP-binding protein [Candidatus Eisenbacteria bacterium]
MDALRITGLRKTYAGGVEALRGVDLTIAEGDFFALLGANGAGKTTLINITVGLVTKSAGKVTVFGIDQDADPDGVKAQIGIVPQEFNFNIFETVHDIVTTQGGYYGMSRADASARADELLSDLGLSDKRDVPSRMLSGGMKRRLMIARALVHRPRLLMLDEPTAGVDVELRRGMWDYLRALNAKGTTILLTTHYLEEVEQLCKNMTIIQRGSVVKTGAVRALLAEAEGRRYRVTLAGAVTEAQAKAIGAEETDGEAVMVTLHGTETLDGLFERTRAAGVKVLDIAHSHNRLEELYLSTLTP